MIQHCCTQIVVDGVMMSQHFDPRLVMMYSQATAGHVYPHKLIGVSEANNNEQLQEQLQQLQEQLAKQKSQTARAEAKANHYKGLYKEAISTKSG